jgi:hypothetical protein
VAGIQGSPFQVCFDKGTYDALMLNPGASKSDVTRAYAANVRRSLLDGGRLVLTSCNWTQEELCQHFKDCEFRI